MISAFGEIAAVKGVAFLLDREHWLQGRHVIILKYACSDWSGCYVLVTPNILLAE